MVDATVTIIFFSTAWTTTTPQFPAFQTECWRQTLIQPRNSASSPTISMPSSDAIQAQLLTLSPKAARIHSEAAFTNLAAGTASEGCATGSILPARAP